MGLPAKGQYGQAERELPVASKPCEDGSAPACGEFVESVCFENTIFSCFLVEPKAHERLWQGNILSVVKNIYIFLLYGHCLELYYS
jgi:hypothetical protein